MFDSDYERTKEYLRSKLPEYLRSRGINPDGDFNCLNPQHPDRQQRMSYNPHNFTVRCFGCNASYDIFALIGQEYGITDFTAQYRKAYEMFIGPLPTEVQHSYETAGAATFGARPEPTFELKHQGFDSRTANPNPPSFSPLFVKAAESVPESFKRPSGVSFGAQADNEGKPPYQQQPLQPTGAVFGIGGGNYRQSGGSFISSSNERAYHEQLEPKYNHAEYLRQAADNVGKTDFYRQHGLSDDIVARFHLGFDESFAAGADAHTGEQILWRAAIIPYSDFGYAIINADPKATDRQRIRGTLTVFNENALQRKGAVFICQSELDALSLESLGYAALALSGHGSVRILLDLIDKSLNFERIFYICLNDADRSEQVKALCAGLYNLKVPFKKIDPGYPYLSINQALCVDKAGLGYRLSHLEELLTFSLSPVPREHEHYFFIDDATALSQLNLSPYLYALCSTTSVLRRCLNLIMQERLCRLITVTTAQAWRFICNELEDNEQPAPNALPFEPYPNAKAVLLDSAEVKEACERIRYALNALRLQREGNFTLCVDLCVFAPQDRAELMAGLQQISAGQKCALLLLCPESSTELCESTCLQTIRVNPSDDGSELIFKSCSLSGRPLNFTRYAGD